jgi:hypothetical protein
MSTLKIAALAAALTAGMAASAQAQYGDHWYGGPRHPGYHQPSPPVWAPPKVQRKYWQQYERFVERFGAPRPHHYSHRPHWQHGYEYQPYAHPHARPPRIVFDYGW